MLPKVSILFRCHHVIFLSSPMNLSLLPFLLAASWEFFPNHNNDTTPTHAILNLPPQILHIQPIYGHSHGTAQIFSHFHSGEGYS